MTIVALVLVALSIHSEWWRRREIRRKLATLTKVLPSAVQALERAAGEPAIEYELRRDLWQVPKLAKLRTAQGYRMEIEL